VGCKHCFNLCEFDAEPIYFHLVVHAPYEDVVTFTALEKRPGDMQGDKQRIRQRGEEVITVNL
jgi:hypothetical protein